MAKPARVDANVRIEEAVAGGVGVTEISNDDRVANSVRYLPPWLSTTMYVTRTGIHDSFSYLSQNDQSLSTR